MNLQQAHLMVNYDLPWNPSRLEQRFGRIHRIGQTEVCHMWNLVAANTREGEVYLRLLEKLEEQSRDLGGRVFDVLGQLFQDHPLRDLLIEAIRYGEDPEVRARLFRKVEGAVDRKRLLALLEGALAKEVLDPRRLSDLREEMERAEARRLQPHYLTSFFREALERLGGSVHPREAGRMEVTFVPPGRADRGAPAVHPGDLPQGPGEPSRKAPGRLSCSRAPPLGRGAKGHAGGLGGVPGAGDGAGGRGGHGAPARPCPGARGGRRPGARFPAPPLRGGEP